MIDRDDIDTTNRDDCQAFIRLVRAAMTRDRVCHCCEFKDSPATDVFGLYMERTDDDGTTSNICQYSFNIDARNRNVYVGRHVLGAAVQPSPVMFNIDAPGSTTREALRDTVHEVRRIYGLDVSDATVEAVLPALEEVIPD